MKRNIQHRNTQQRRHAIMQLLQEQGEVSVEQLVQLFDTSEVTIRKDLTALESNGFLLRKQLNRKQGLVVMTNSLSVATALRSLENEPTLLMTGGTWDTRSESFQGNIAEQVLRSYDFDQLFIGADGIDLERGTTTFNELVRLSQVMAEVSREVIVMVESQKIGRKMPNVELTWQQIDVLITDNKLSQANKEAIMAQGVEVICVDVA